MPQNITLYAYLNIEHPVVAWEVAIGRIKSSCDSKDDEFGVSFWHYSLLKTYSEQGLSRKFINELKLEKIRQKECPEQISRLKGAYFFENLDLAHTALERWGMPQRKKYISAVSFSANHLSKLDSEWITHYLNSENDNWMTSYWKGETHGEQPLYEILASGIGIVQNKALRIQAYKNIINAAPDSTPLLAMSSCAFIIKKIETIGLSMPALVSDNGYIKGAYYIYIDDLKKHEAEIIEAVSTCKDRDELPPALLPEQSNVFFKLPDTRYLHFVLKNKEAHEIFSHLRINTE